MRRILLPLVLLAVFAAPAALAPRAQAAPRADTGIALVRATYDDLLDLFYQPLDPPGLLTAGWSAYRQALARANLPAAPDLPPLPGDRDGAFAAFQAVYDGFATHLPAGVSATNLPLFVASSMVRSLNEQHTFFLAAQDYQNYIAAGSNTQQVGTGLTRTLLPPWVVTEVAPDGPADRAGIKPGDVITAVNGMDLTNATSAQVSQALAGSAGTVLQITLGRGGPLLTASLTIGRFLFPVLGERLLPGGVGYLKLRQFAGSGVFPALDRDLDDLDARGARGLVLDLRDNPGGSTTTTAELLGRFLPEDTETLLRYDGRGHRAIGIVSGLMRPKQLPLVVLVNNRSYSSSETAVSTLRESGRALLVGQRTGGALAVGQVVGLPGGNGLQVAVAQDVSARTGVMIDGNGVDVDVPVPDSRTADDYRNGRDPQLDAAVAALAQAPAPLPFLSTTSPIPPADLRSLLAPYAPDPGVLQDGGVVPSLVPTGSLDAIHENQVIGMNADDPVALQATMRARGWLGEHLQAYSPADAPYPSLVLGIDLYQSEDGAADAVLTDDYPEIEEPMALAGGVGDRSAAYQGVWLSRDSYSLVWQRGGLVFTLTIRDAHGMAKPDALLPLAQQIDAAYLASPFALPPAYQPAPSLAPIS